MGEPQLVEHGVGGEPALAAPVAEEPGDHAHVLAAAHRRLDGGVLAGEADDAPHAVGMAGDVDPGDAQTARVGACERRDRPDEGGLAGAVGAEQRKHPAGRHDEIEAGEGLDLAVALGEALGLDDGLHARSVRHSSGFVNHTFD